MNFKPEQEFKPWPLQCQCGALQYLYFYGLIIEPRHNQLPVGLVAQLVEHCTTIEEVRVQIPVQAFLAVAYAALKCDDQIHSFQYSTFQIQEFMYHHQ